MNLKIHSKTNKGILAHIIITSIFLLVLSTHVNALSNSGGGTWQYYRDISINNTGVELSDYQILVNLTGAAFPARANASGADIRFEQSGMEQSYWIEKWDYANASALVWVNVTSVPVGEGVVRMLYGNGIANDSSNKNATFPLYDVYPDFSAWSSSSVSSCGSYKMMGGYNIFGSGANTQKTITNLAAGNYSVAFDYYHIDSWDGESGRFFWNGALKWSRAHNLGGSNICGGGWGDSNGLSYGKTTVIVNHLGGDATIKFDSTLDQGASDESWGVNNIIVRKYSASEPSLSIMPEQLNSNIAILTFSPSAKTTYPDYVETFTLWINNTQTIQDNFTLSCPNCTFSENPVKVDSLQNKSISVNITSSSSPGLKFYVINATSQANSSNSTNGYVSITVDATKWRSLWNDAYNNEFKFRLPLTISNSNPALNDYQLNFTIDSASNSRYGCKRMQ